jgi:hypothetical protein
MTAKPRGGSRMEGIGDQIRDLTREGFGEARWVTYAELARIRGWCSARDGDGNRGMTEASGRWCRSSG